MRLPDRKRIFVAAAIPNGPLPLVAVDPTTLVDFATLLEALSPAKGATPAGMRPLRGVLMGYGH